MNALNKSEELIENKFAHDEEVKFRVGARRCRLVGLWAGGLLGVEDRSSYARGLVDLYVHTPAEDVIVEKLARDFTEAGVEIARHDIRIKMVELLFNAIDDVAAA